MPEATSKEQTYQNYDGAEKNELTGEDENDYDVLSIQQTDGETYEGLHDPAMYYQMP